MMSITNRLVEAIVWSVHRITRADQMLNKPNTMTALVANVIDAATSRCCRRDNQ